MIFCLTVRNFKTYKNIQVIPISNGKNFNGFIGMNGIGKSSILEAFDCFFNNDKEWVKTSGTTDESWVMPIFAIEKKTHILDEKKDEIEKITNYILSDNSSDNKQKQNLKNNPTEHINKIREFIPSEMKKDYYIVPICKKSDGVVDFGFFNNTFKQNFLGEDKENSDLASIIYNKIIDFYTYVYVPKDIEAERFIAFQNQDLQRLMGEELTDIIQKKLPKETIEKISKELKNFIDEFSNSLSDYKFKTNKTRQRNLKSKKIYDLIAKEFFSVRELHKNNIPLTQLSSGEKQQAIIDIITKTATHYRKSSERLIVAIDEPESSLHVSLCFEQFEKLYEVSKKCSQVFFTSHWYGFIPTLEKGSIVNISEKNSNHEFYIFNAEKYREEIKQEINKTKGNLPIDIMVKSSNDLVQSILCSIIKEDCYNWLICEGSSDKIYLNSYLEDEVKNKKLRIVPVCKASEVKKLYNHLTVAIEELKDKVKGKVFLLTDTDAEFLNFETQDDIKKTIICRRIVNENDITKLVKINANPKSPKTDIEDALNGKAFYQTLKKFKDNNTELSFINSELDISETNNNKQVISSYKALDLRQTEYEKLDEFFSKNNSKNKVEFANKYTEIIKKGDFKIPSWIEEIKDFFNK